MPELGPYGSVQGARGNSRPYRESDRLTVKTARATAQNGLHSPRKKYKLSILPRLSKGACKPGGDVQEIADWLGRLGLVQYAQRFAENEIDVSVLPHLTDQDLKDIRIPLGHRRKILAVRPHPKSLLLQ